MPSFDIVSKADVQQLDNAVNVTLREVQNRYDFRNSETQIVLNKKDLVINIETEDDMKLKSVEDILLTRAVKQGLDGRCFDFSKEIVPSGKIVKKDIKVKSGIEKEDAKKIIKIIKDTKLKVEPQIMDDQVRVSAKKIDDLQAVIQHLKKSDVGLPLQFINMK
ncbi:MAG: YajQ family cyclic di-GMP-binding protein [Cytophagales bacterium]|nr:YajQ family cyclic di-GMP-binding protein [Cytophagales bacterium]